MYPIWGILDGSYKLANSGIFFQIKFQFIFARFLASFQVVSPLVMRQALLHVHHFRTFCHRLRPLSHRFGRYGIVFECYDGNIYFCYSVVFEPSDIVFGCYDTKTNFSGFCLKIGYFLEFLANFHAFVGTLVYWHRFFILFYILEA